MWRNSSSHEYELTGRPGRLHIFQTLAPSHRAQVFIENCTVKALTVN